MKILLVLVLLLTVAAAQAPAPKEVPVTEEPSHHLVLENQYTRTYQVEVGPGKATLLHRHDHDYVFVVIGDADISNEVLGSHPVEQKLKDGDVKFAQGGFAHVARNLASTPFRNVTIEVLRRTKRKICGFEDTPACPNGQLVSGILIYAPFTLFETDAVKVARETIGPGGTTGRYRRGTALIIAVSDLHLKDDVGGRTAEIQQRAGDVKWVEGGEHELRNVGTTIAQFVTVEFR